MEQHPDLTVLSLLLEVNLLCLEVPGDIRVLLLCTSNFRPRHKNNAMECRRACKNEDSAGTILKRESIDICCIQETHLKKDKTFRMRRYQCIRTDRARNRNKGGVLTLVESNINGYILVVAQQTPLNTKLSNLNLKRMKFTW